MAVSGALRLLKRDNAVVGAGLFGICALSWLYLFWMAREMASSASVCMANMTGAWTFQYFFMTFMMWVIMMVAMMVPSVSPMVLTFATLNRKRSEAGRAFVPTWVFLSGYLAVWTAFSWLATLLQWGLHRASLLVPATLTVSPIVGGALLVAAGVYQWTPLKNACLARCVSPLGFLVTEWREGARGAFIMGIRHGAFCVGCCALLMALLFVAGVMNLLWVALLGGLVLLEKLAPAGRRMSHVFGLLFVIAGVLLPVLNLKLKG